MNENLEALYQSIQRNTDNIFPDELVRLTPEQLEEGLRDERNRFGMFSSMQRHYPAKFGQMKFEDFSNALGYEMANWDDSLRILQEEQARERAESGVKPAVAEEKGQPSVWQTFYKGLGAGAIRTANGLLGFLNRANSSQIAYDPMTLQQMAKQGMSPEEIARVTDATKARLDNAEMERYEAWNKKAEQLSAESKPDDGEKTFTEYIADGKIGKALQLGLGTAAESLPYTVSALNPVATAGMIMSMSEQNFRQSLKDNPDMSDGQRIASAVGNAAIEMAVEHIGNPFKVFRVGKLTASTATKWIKEVVKQSKDNIYKGILRVLGFGAKEAGKEGLEEVVTTAGQDLYNTLLDWKDTNGLGLRSQWERAKKKDPNLTIEQFAASKADGLANDFIGGALSGMMMSGPSTGVGIVQNAKYYSKNGGSEASRMQAQQQLAVLQQLSDEFGVSQEEVAQAIVDFQAERELTPNQQAIINRGEELLTAIQSEQTTPEQPAETPEQPAEEEHTETEEAKEEEQVVTPEEKAPDETDGGSVSTPQRLATRTIEVNINDTPVPVTITGAAIVNEDGSIDFASSKRVYLIDNDGTPFGESMREDVQTAVNEYLIQEKENGEELEKNDQPIVETPVEEMPAIEESPATEPSAYPLLEDGTPDFAQMTPEQQVAYAIETGGEEAAAETIQTAIEELTAELESVGKKKGLVPAQRVAEKNRIRQAIAAWQALVQPQENAPAQSDIRPVGISDFGPIYDQFRGKPQEAIAFLLEKQDGECLGALSHSDIGPIDLVWGYEGTGDSDGFGLAKLVKFHPEVLDNLQGILDEMHVTLRSENRIQLESERYKAGVRLTWNNESKTWLLTAFEKVEHEENNAPGKTTDTAETAKSGEGNDTPLPQSIVSGDKGTTKNPDTQISGEENAEKVDLSAENVVLMYNGNRSNYVFCRKGEDGTLVRLDTGKPLELTRNGKDTAWQEIGKRKVRTADGEYYILSTLNEKDLQFYNQKGGMIKVMPVDNGGAINVPIADLSWEDGTPVYKRSSDRRNPQFAELKKTAKNLDDIADYVVLDYTKNGVKVEVTLRDLLHMFSTVDEDMNRIYVGDKRYVGIIDKLLSDMGNDTEARASVEDMLNDRVKEAAVVWNTIAEEGESVKETQSLPKKIRTFIDVLDKRGWVDKADYFAGRVKPKKRAATEEDIARHKELREAMKDVETMAELEEIQKEIAALREQVEFNIGETEINEEAGMRTIGYLREAGIAIKAVSIEEAEQMISDEKAEQMRTSGGVLYGFTKDGEIYVISGRLNPTTPVHEYTHLWAKAFARKNSRKWADIVKVLKQTEQWQEVIDDANYADIKENENAVASEVLARLSGEYWGQIGEDGKSKMDEAFEKKALLARVRTALRSFWKQVGAWLGKKINLRQDDADAQLQTIIRQPIQDLIGLQSGGTDLHISEKSSIFAPEMQNELALDRYESRITGNGETVAERRQTTDSGLLEDAQRHLARRDGDAHQVSRQGTGTEEDIERRNAEDATALEQFAKERGQWVEDIETAFTERYGAFIGHGSESFVWRKDDDTVIKSRTIDPKAGGYATIQEALDSIAIHNRIFPETAMKVVGFGMDEGELNILFEQPYFEMDRYAEPEEIQQFVSENFGAVKDESVEGGQSYKTAAYLLQDLKPKNVIVKNIDGKDQLFVIDGDFYYTPEHRRFLSETDAWLNDGDAELLVASPSDMPIGHAERMNWLQRAVNAVADQANGIRLMQKQIGEIEGKPIGMDKDVREALEAKRSKIANTLERFGMRQRRALKKALRNIQKSIKEKGLWHKGQTDDYLNEQGERSPRKVTLLNVLEEYLEAKDILERLSQGRNVRLEELPVRLLQQMGMSFEEAMQTDLATVEQKASVLQRWVDEFESKMPKEQVDALWSAVNGCTNFTLDVLLDGGLIGQNLYDELKRSKYYVPERGFAQLESDEDVRQEAERVQGWKSRTKSNSPEATRKAKGGKSMATDVIANILHIAVNAVSCAEENKVRQAAFNLLKDHQEACQQLGYPAAERVWYVRDGFDEEGEPRYKAQIEKPSAEIIAQNEEVLELIRGYREDMALFEDNKAMQDFIREKIKEAQKELLIVRKADAGDAVKIRAGLAGEDIPRVVVTMPTDDGETEQYTMVFPNHREISNALNGIYNSAFTDSWLKNVGRFFASMFTTHNPLFWSRNLPRDAMFVLQKGTAERGIGYGAFFAAEMARPATTIAPIVAWVSGHEIDSEIGRDFRKFLDGGGNTGFTQMKDIEAFRREADKLANGENFAVASLRFIFGKVPAALNEFSELWTRFAVYRATKASLAMENRMIQTLGRSPVDVKRTTPYSDEEIEAMALHDSRNFSANFNRRGAGGFVDFFNSISMFANATIQGASGVIRTFEQGEYQKWIRGSMSLMIIPAFLGYILTLLSPDDEDEEKKIPDYIRQNNLVFIDKRVPMSYELVPWYRIGVNYALMEQNRISKTDGIENIVMGFAEHALPAPPSITKSLKEFVDMSIPETDYSSNNPNFWNAILPLIYGEFANPFMELAHGKNWTGSNLRYAYAQDKPQWMFQDYEAELYKSISKELYEVLGKGDMNNPSITVNGKKMNDFENMSPKEIKNIIGSVAPNGWLKIACYGWGLWKGNVREQDIPLRSDFEIDTNTEMYRIGISSEMNAMIREAKENYTRIPGLRESDQKEAEQRIKEWDSIYKDYTELRKNGTGMTDNNRKACQRRLERMYGISIDGNSVEDLMHAYIIVMTNEEIEMKGLERTIDDLERWRKKYDNAPSWIFEGK